LGARTAIGMTAPATAAAVRAGIAGFGPHPFMVDTAGNHMIVARTPFLGIDETGTERLAALAGPAAAEAIALVAGLPSQRVIPVFVGVPSQRPGRDTDLRAVADTVASQMSAHGVRCGRIALLESGHAAGMNAVQSAWDAVASGLVEFALAGGVDSYLE